MAITVESISSGNNWTPGLELKQELYSTTLPQYLLFPEGAN